MSAPAASSAAAQRAWMSRSRSPGRQAASATAARPRRRGRGRRGRRARRPTAPAGARRGLRWHRRRTRGGRRRPAGRPAGRPESLGRLDEGVGVLPGHDHQLGESVRGRAVFVPDPVGLDVGRDQRGAAVRGKHGPDEIESPRSGRRAAPLRRTPRRPRPDRSAPARPERGPRHPRARRGCARPTARAPHCGPRGLALFRLALSGLALSLSRQRRSGLWRCRLPGRCSAVPNDVV